MGSRNSKDSETSDDFFIKYNKNNDVNSGAPLCYKRVIFISLLGLYQTYRQCPSYILYSAIFIVPLKRQWIYSPSKYIDELRAVSSGLLQHDTPNVRQLFELIQWKDSQGLVLWAKDEHKSSNANDLTHPFWTYVSRKLESLYDPMTSHHYKPLELDGNHWKSSKLVPVSDMLYEIYFATLKYKSMQILLNSSNPESFHVITGYNDDYPRVTFIKTEIIEDDDDDNCTDCDAKAPRDEWWISSDYCS